MSYIHYSIVPGLKPKVAQLNITESKMGYNLTDGKLYALKIVNGLKAVILIGGGGSGTTGDTHPREHSMISGLDHIPVAPGDEGKIPQADPVTRKWILVPMPVNGINGSDGKDGADGITPVKGIDYFDGADGKDGVDGTTPIKGVDYFDGKDGTDGITPVKGVDYFDGTDGMDGKPAFVYIAYACDAAGTGWSVTPNQLLKYIAFIQSDVPKTPLESDFASAIWIKYIGDGTSEGWDFQAYDNAGAPVLGRTVNQGSNLQFHAGAHIRFDALQSMEGVVVSVENLEGISTFLYVAYASTGTGTRWSLTPDVSLKYRAEIQSTTELSPSESDFAQAVWVKYIGDDGPAGGSDTFEVYIDFKVVKPFVYNCPYALRFNFQLSEGADASVSPSLTTSLTQYQKVTVTPAGVGLIILIGELL